MKRSSDRRRHDPDQRHSFLALEDYCAYMGAVLGRSPLTIKEYRKDILAFFNFYLRTHHYVNEDISDELIDYRVIDDAILQEVKLVDLYSYLNYLMGQKRSSAASRARKVSSLRRFFNYLTEKLHIIKTDPTHSLETPKIAKRLPVYLDLDESVMLLKSLSDELADPHNWMAKRDFCILMMFLNCGMRLAELCALDIQDIHDEELRVIGKGNKERKIYLNVAVTQALQDWLLAREKIETKDPHERALFISKQGRRMAHSSVQHMVKQRIGQAGLDTRRFSPHKLRHTAATLMFQHGHIDIRTLQGILGHESVATTEIYTHVSDQQKYEAMAQNPLAKIQANEETRIGASQRAKTTKSDSASSPPTSTTSTTSTKRKSSPAKKSTGRQKKGD